MLPIPAPQQVPRGLNGGPASAGTWIMWEIASALAGAGLLRVQVLTVFFFCSRVQTTHSLPLC